MSREYKSEEIEGKFGTTTLVKFLQATNHSAHPPALLCVMIAFNGPIYQVKSQNLDGSCPVAVSNFMNGLK